MAGNIWDSYVESNARRFGVPPALVQSVIGAESGGRANAVSRAGAGGYMQLMPNTYAELAQKHGFGEDRFDPANNIGAGTSYMRQLYDKYGNWPDAIAAYNAGPGRVDRVKAGTSTMPAETQAYVPGVLKRAGMQGTDMAYGTRRTTAGMTDDEMLELSRNDAMPRPGSGGLLGVEPEKNYFDGLGGLLGKGQTPSQPPGPSLAQPPSDQASLGRMNVNSRMDELMQGLLAPQTRGPSMTPGQYQLAGAGDAVGKLAGVHDRKVGFGEILGALGGGLTRGTAAGEQAQQEQRSQQFQELGNIGKIQDYQRKEATSQRQLAAANAYADQIQSINPALAAALRDNPPLMDEVAKAQAAKTFEKNPDPTAAHQNALAMGLRPGTPEYNQYIRDATVRAGESSSTSPMKNAIAMGLQPGTAAYNDYIQKATMPAGSININNAQEKSENVAMGQELVKDYAVVREQSAAAENSLAQIEIAMRIPVTTGTTAPYLAKAGALAQALGFDRKILSQYGLGDASNAEAFTGVMNNLVISRMQAQKGPQTENDARRIEATLASLGNTPEAANFLLRTAKALARRDVDKMAFYDDYRGRNQGSLDGVGAAWRSHLSDSPLVGINPTTKQPVFYDEFVTGFRKANPNATIEDTRKVWSEKYGG